jgi:hypothetical protein
MSSSHFVPLGEGSCRYAEPAIHMLSPATKWPSRKAEFVFPASRNKPKGASGASVPSLSR